MAERILEIGSYETTTKLFGAYDRNLRLLEEAFAVSITNRQSSVGTGDRICIQGEDSACDRALEAVRYLLDMTRLEESLSEQAVRYVIGMVKTGKQAELATLDDRCICLSSKGKPIKARTVGQQRYVELISKNTVTMGIGPAGTGKTFLAVAMAVTALRSKQVSRLILTRPAVEAGERLGYLPGDLQSKIDPYLRPLYDALYELLGAENYARHVEKGSIEVAPLAYMRGRTLDDAFIILDEAQNTTPEQMKMFLTRLGNGSKAVVTGDITQTDLPFGQKSGLREAVSILRGIEDIGIHEFSEKDVVRHKLVQKIILAYDRYEKEKQQSAARRKDGSRGVAASSDATDRPRAVRTPRKEPQQRTERYERRTKK